MPDLELFAEANRQLVICNACRYCEGYCPVFPALEARRVVTEGDVVFLAHLCHDCRACLDACMYSPPHEFAVNLPKILTEVRIENYQRWSWPAFLARAFTEQRIGAILVSTTMSVVLVLTYFLAGPRTLFSIHTGPGSFYEIIPYAVMTATAIGLCIYSAIVWFAGGGKFWREATDSIRQHGSFKAFYLALVDVLTLRGMKGGGPGCYYPKAEPSSSRRLCHTLVFYGFTFDLISTTLAWIYQDLMHRLPPYSLTSAPVIFGTLGGIALVIGVGGLLTLKVQSRREPTTSDSIGLDYLFLISLGMTSLTGLVLLVFRSTPGMGVLLAIHLGFVAAFFISAPYGKFVHAMYRSLALLRHRVEDLHHTQIKTH
jgi:citrate/tricarballylate utilization protein